MKANMILNEILNVKEPADRVHMSLTADHKWLAFCLCGTSKGPSEGVSMAVEGFQQWVCELETGKLIQVAPHAKSSWAGVWSPDGENLAFYADIDGTARLWLWSPSDQKLKLASNATARPFFGFEKPIWTKDGQRIIIKSMPSEKVEDSFFYSSPDARSFKIDKFKKPLIFSTSRSEKDKNDTNTTSWAGRYQADIVVIDRVTGDTTPLCIGERPVGMVLSHNGEYLAFTSCQGEETVNSQQNLFHLWVCPVHENAIPRCIDRNIRFDYGLSFCWGYDNQSIYYTTRGPLSDGGLWSVRLSNPNKTKLIGKPENTHLGREYDGPIPLPNGELLMVAGGCLWHYSSGTEEFKKVELERKIIAAFPPFDDDACILVQTRDLLYGVDGFWEINLTTWRAEKILEEHFGHLPWFEGGAAYGYREGASALAYIAQNADEPPTLRLRNDSNKPTRIVELTKVNENHLGTTELLAWNSNNRTMRGALLLPKNINGCVPVIMRVYGGAMQSNNFRYFGLSTAAADNHHVFSSNGFAVFMPDLPMDRSHEPAEEITIAIEDALRALLQHPKIDPDKIGIIGHSFGGYSALVAITKIPAIKAAVISAGIGSLISFYTNFDPMLHVYNYGWVEDGQANMGASLWENKDRYIRNSPLFDLDKVQAPVLIVQGIRDNLCRNEAGPIFSGLNRLGKTAEMAIYDEEHWQGTWKRENLEDYYNRVLTWFSKHL